MAHRHREGFTQGQSLGIEQLAHMLLLPRIDAQHRAASNQRALLNVAKTMHILPPLVEGGESGDTRMVPPEKIPQLNQHFFQHRHRYA